MTPRRMAPWAALLLVPTLLAGGAAATQAGPGRAEPTSDKVCAAPALDPSLKIGRKQPKLDELTADQVGVARDIAAGGKRAQAPARAQAIALMTAWSTSGLSGDDKRFAFTTPIPGAEGAADGGMNTAEFYASLLEVKGWQSLPPGIAAHRAVGDADPFRHDRFWDASVSLLGALAADPTIDPERAVATGARSAARCAPVSAEGIGLPLPAGTSYRLRPSGVKKPASSPSLRGREDAEFEVHCGTPVLSTGAGAVTVRSETEGASGPWLVGVRNKTAGVTIWYHHVMTPVVRTGQSVGAGTPLAEVGDFGDTDTCSLGVGVWERRGKKKTEKPVDAATWLRENARPDAVLVPTKKAKKKKRKEIPATTFRVGSFNVLGSHLTGAGGSKSGYGPGPDRMRAGVGLLEASSIDIVALNEFETPQADVFEADPDWGLHRATGNAPVGSSGTNGNAIAWRSDRWELVKVEDEVVVPWQVVLHMPVVRLRNVETGRQVLVMAIHNPASTKRQGNQQGARDAARSIELDAVRTLRDSLKLPVLVMGDMNERDAVFCHFTGSGDLVAAAGGSTGGSCQPPGYGGVDWIFGSPGLVFSDFFVDKSTLSRISDHALVSSTVEIPGS